MFEGYFRIYEVSVALVTTILGLAYPIFVDKINGIADKYNSIRILEMFKREKTYRYYNFLIIVCIIEMFVFPILMTSYHTPNIIQWLITIQGICVFTLCIVIIRLCHLLMTYNEPFNLLERTKVNEPLESELECLEVLILYGSRNETNSRLYEEAVEELMRCFFKFQEEKLVEYKKYENNNVSDVPKDTFFMYNNRMNKVIRNLLLGSSEVSNVILNTHADIVDIVFGIFDIPITEQVYKSLWFGINKMAGAQHDAWLKQYWSKATQHYNFRLDYSDKWEEKEKFTEFHLMVCVLLLYRERYEVLQYAFNFTTTLPPAYPLIPNTFKCIFDYCKKLPPQNNPFYLSNYYMYGDYQGANTEYKIEGLLLDYLALLLVRSHFVNNGNIALDTPEYFPQVGNTIEENAFNINKIETIIAHLDNIPKSTIDVLHLKTEWKEKAKESLERYKEFCLKKNVELSERRVLAEDKRQHIKNSLIESSQSELPFLPLNYSEGEKTDAGVCLFEQKIRLADMMILDSYLFISSNIGASMIQGIYVQLRQDYCSRLFQINPLKTYTISYNFVSKALKKLCLSSQYAILAINIAPHLFYEIDVRYYTCEKMYYGNCRVYSISSIGMESSFIIMREIDVPRFEYRPLGEREYINDVEKEIESCKHLYSNIDSITVDQLKLTVKQGFYIHISKQMQYVHIQIVQGLNSNNTNASNVEPINKLYEHGKQMF